MSDPRATLTPAQLLARCAPPSCGPHAFEVRDEYTGAYCGSLCALCALELRDRGLPYRLTPYALAEQLPPRA